jgi:hypothetical protein
MPLSQSQRNQITSYKIRIEGYRKDLQRIKDDKKSNHELSSHRVCVENVA